MSKHFACFDILLIDEHNAVNGINMCQVVDEVSFAQVYCDLAVRRALLEDSRPRLFAVVFGRVIH